MSKDKTYVIYAEAEGYNTGATAFHYLITNKDYSEKLKNINYYITELDGKHSEIQCELKCKELDLQWLGENITNSTEVYGSNEVFEQINDGLEIEYDSKEEKEFIEFFDDFESRLKIENKIIVTLQSK